MERDKEIRNNIDIPELSALKKWRSPQIVCIDLLDTNGTKFFNGATEGVPAGWPAWATVSPS